MKRLVLVLLAVVVLVNMSTAQDVMPAIKSGAKSLNFTFVGLGTFGVGPAGAGGGIGLSYFMNDAALRFGLNVGTSSTTTPAGATGFSDAKASTFDAGIGVDYLMYSSGLTQRLRPYMGAGIGISFGSSTTEPSVASPPPAGTVTKVTNTRGTDGISFSLAAIVGGEFFLYNDVSLSAEYRLGVVKITQGADSETTTQGAATTTAKGPSTTGLLGFGTTALMLHLYW